MQAKVSTAIILEKRFPRKDGSFSVKLRITYQRKQKYYASGLALTEEVFDKVMGDKPRGKNKNLQVELTSIENEAVKVIQKLDEFSFEEFEQRFLKKRTEPSNIFHGLERYIEELEKADRIRTADTYRTTLRSLQKFHKKSRLMADKITPAFLQKYENWMLEQNRSVSTIGIYLRSLRTILNQCIRAGHLDPEKYPFGKGKYQIPASRNVKKALSLDEVRLIFQYKPDPMNLREGRSKDLWLFSYLCNGMNMKDIFMLKNLNIQGEKLTYFREKTKRSTKQDQTPITVSLLPQTQDLISRWRNKSKKPEAFLFPILKSGLDSKETIKLIKQETDVINSYMRKIGKTLEIQKDITTYTARHTFSTVLKRSGAPIAFISESLGHKSLSTTERYLDSFEDEARKKYTENLLDF